MTGIGYCLQNDTFKIPDGFECDFEKNKCGWKITSDSNVNWIRTNGDYNIRPKRDQ